MRFRCAVVVVAMLGRVSVAAEPGITGDDVAAMLRTYTRGEQLSIVPFGLAGASTVTAGALMLASQNQIARGAGWPLLTLGIVELIAGTFFSLRAAGEEAAARALLETNPAEFALRQREKVHRITHRFQPALLAFEAALAVAGGAMAGVGALKNQDTLLGVGLGLAVQALVFFAIDWAVLDRTQGYEAGLSRFLP